MPRTRPRQLPRKGSHRQVGSLRRSTPGRSHQTSGRTASLRGGTAGSRDPRTRRSSARPRDASSRSNRANRRRSRHPMLRRPPGTSSDCRRVRNTVPADVAVANLQPPRSPTARPPAAGTRCSPLLEAKTITPSAFHVPPSRSGVSQMFCGGPPAASTFLSVPPAKNPIHRLSGDQNSRARAFGTSELLSDLQLIARTNSAVEPPSAAEYATRRPSGETETASAAGMSGTSMRKRFSARAVGAGDISATTDITATSSVTPTSASCAIFTRRCRRPPAPPGRRPRASPAIQCSSRHEIGRGLQTLFGIFRQTALDEKVERGRRRAVAPSRRIWLRRDDRGDQVRLALAFERLPPVTIS